MAAIETEVAVVGSGPGGARVARELARKGRQVTLLEKGKWHRWQVGRSASVDGMTKLFRSAQGGLMARAITAGGSSLIFNGNGFKPPSWLVSELGGAKPNSICVAENLWGHPGGTAAIDAVVDRDLRAQAAENLFVCEASVLPRSPPGRTPTLTIIGLAERLAASL